MDGSMDVITLVGGDLLMFSLIVLLRLVVGESVENTMATPAVGS
jgi:hypothetical protein